MAAQAAGWIAVQISLVSFVGTAPLAQAAGWIAVQIGLDSLMGTAPLAQAAGWIAVQIGLDSLMGTLGQEVNRIGVRRLYGGYLPIRWARWRRAS
jgi:hypothetical protein